METKIWFTSDTHFGSIRTMTLSRRPFKTVEEMDKVLIDNWNNMVGVNDIVYHLGDFGDYTTAAKLNGHINLVTGNYERFDRDKVIENKHLFNSIHENICDLWVEYEKNNKIYGYHINMSHEPSWVKQNEIDAYSINVFGHIHKLCMVKPFGLNVGTDCHNFCPINLETVLYYHNGIISFYDSEVFD